jgi:hypothetical protein
VTNPYRKETRDWLKIILGAVALLVCVGFVFGYRLKLGGRPVAGAFEKAAKCDLVCTLSPAELDLRRERLASFAARARKVEAIENGYALRLGFDAEGLEEAMSLIAAETRCCSFLEFRLTVRPTHDLLAIEITGPPGTQELLDGVLAVERPALRSGVTAPQH